MDCKNTIYSSKRTLYLNCIFNELFLLIFLQVEIFLKKELILKNVVICFKVKTYSN
jgi:hypothetical protein